MSYTKEDQEIIDSIRADFLTLVHDKREGYFISLENVYVWLKVPNKFNDYVSNVNIRKHFIARTLKNSKFALRQSTDENDLDKHYIMRKGDRQMLFPWFSNKGFKMYCMICGEDRSYFVCNYFLELEEDYVRVLDQTTEENAAEKKKMHEIIKNKDFDITTLEEKLDKSNTKFAKSDAENGVLLFKVKQNKKLDEVLDNKEDFANVGNSEYKEYMYLKNTYMKKVALYIVNQTHINKDVKKIVKKIDRKPKKCPFGLDDDSDHSDNYYYDSNDEEVRCKRVSNPKTKSDNKDEACNNDLEYEKEFNKYNFDNDINVDKTSGRSSPILYYFIGSITPVAKSDKNDKNDKYEKDKKLKPKENFHKICDIWVKDKFHLADIKEILNSDDKDSDNKYLYKTSKKNIYKVDYTFIKNLCLAGTQEMLRNNIKNGRF